MVLIYVRNSYTSFLTDKQLSACYIAIMPFSPIQVSAFKSLVVLSALNLSDISFKL